eukprot:TRINITY_DN6427_c0_g2_i3.p1 TRINITY_DN6427_c0_g2~~TRINITY_DN6427_c0_g2_i3.p1  ORF type:complete len:878 (+),score=145.51 TRINITY_DN6427_c0_g2_i3:75-2708(+)
MTAVGSVVCRPEMPREVHESGILRIFLSSTFRDMQHERDAFFRFGAPMVYNAARKKSLEVVFYDLRWGITSEESGSGQVVHLCLQAIAMSPYFVCFLGDRYGWIPNKQNPSEWHPSTDAAYPWIVDMPDISVTEMEIQYGALIPDAKCYRPFFYFRDASCVEDMEKDPNKIAIYKSESPFHREMQETLKKNISDRYPCETYYGAQQFAEMLAHDLVRAINTDFVDQQALNPENFAQMQYMRRKLMHYEGRIDEFNCVKDQIMMAKSSSEHYPIVWAASAGLGKSGFLSALHSFLKHESIVDHVLYHFTGSTDESLSVERMLHRFARSTCQGSDAENDQQGAKDEDDGGQEEDDAGGSLNSLATLFSQLSLQDQTYAFLIDSIHLFTGSQQVPYPELLTWLPFKIPSNVHLIVTVDSGHKCFDVMQERKHTHFDLRRLDQNEVGRVVSNYFKTYNKKLTADQVQLIAECPDAGNPSYLRVVMDQLRTFGVFENLSQEITKLTSFAGLSHLYEYAISGFSSSFGKELVMYALNALNVSRTGLSKDDLASYLRRLMQEKFQPSQLNSFYFVLMDYAFVCNGRLIINQSALRNAIRDIYGMDETRVKSIYSEYGKWLLERHNGGEVMDEAFCAEIAFALSYASNHQQLHEYLSDSQVAVRLLQGRYHYEFVNHWRVLKDLGISPLDTYAQVLQSDGEVWVSFYNYFLEVADYEHALSIIRQRIELHGEDEMSTYQMARVFYFTGRYLESLPFYEKALAMRSLQQKASDSQLAAYLHSIGNVNNRLGKYESAIEFYRKSLEVKVTILGEHHPEVARSLNNIGNAQRNLSRYTVALASYNRALEIRLSKLGASHPQTADSYHSLGNVYNNMKDEMCSQQRNVP